MAQPVDGWIDVFDFGTQHSYAELAEASTQAPAPKRRWFLGFYVFFLGF